MDTAFQPVDMAETAEVEVTYVQENGTEQTVIARVGATLMETALLHGIPNIVGLCGGTCSCGTCHCHLREEDFARILAPGEGESEMLDCLDQRAPTSRLGCQVTLTQELSGMRVRVPCSS
jgi:2Fe-2S ferredoxin